VDGELADPLDILLSPELREAALVHQHAIRDAVDNVLRQRPTGSLLQASSNPGVHRRPGFE